MPRVVNEETKEQIRNLYGSKPMSISSLAKQFGLCNITVSRILGDIKRYPKNMVYNPELKEDFFNTIDDEFKAYFLGLIISGGNVFNPCESKHCHNGVKWVSITLDSNDEYMLEKFRQCIGLTANIAHDGRGASTIYVRSDRMADDLSKYGIVERKSFITYLPHIRPDLNRHLIRGIFDGDGSIEAHQNISMDGRCRFLHRMSICGTHKLMSDIVDLINNELNLNTKARVYDYKNRQLSEFGISNIHDVSLFGDWIYKDAVVYLERKRALYEFFKSYYGIGENNELQ